MAHQQNPAETPRPGGVIFIMRKTTGAGRTAQNQAFMLK